MKKAILHLDQNFQPNIQNSLANLIDFETFTFTGGEPHIKILSDLNGVDKIFITHRIKSFNDVGLLLIAVDALKRMNIKKMELVLPYFPAARQDRVMTTGEALTVNVYASLINQLNLESITIFDPHSDVAPALLNHCRIINNFQFINKVIRELPEDLILISPDGGALKKIYKLASHLKHYKVVEASKVRDIATRKLSEFKVYTDDLQGKDCLIVDDICDGGGTFIGLAEQLKAKNAGKLYLAVSHGIFSKGIENLTEVFEQIFTTDSFYDKDIIKEPNRINVFELSI